MTSHLHRRIHATARIGRRRERPRTQNPGRGPKPTIPQAKIDEIIELTKQVSLYEFLRQDVQPGGYHDHKKLVEVARGRLFDKIDDEVRAAVGLVEESEYGRFGWAVDPEGTRFELWEPPPGQ